MAGRSRRGAKNKAERASKSQNDLKSHRFSLRSGLWDPRLFRQNVEGKQAHRREERKEKREERREDRREEGQDKTELSDERREERRERREERGERSKER